MLLDLTNGLPASRGMMLEDLAFGIKKDKNPQSCGGKFVCQQVKIPHRSENIILEVLALS